MLVGFMRRISVVPVCARDWGKKYFERASDGMSCSHGREMDSELDHRKQEHQVRRLLDFMTLECYLVSGGLP
jgi:hypothetical protein